MTRDEAKGWLKAIKDKYIHGGDEEFDEKRKEAVDMAIKALEQEPCENAISSQAYLIFLMSRLRKEMIEDDRYHDRI